MTDTYGLHMIPLYLFTIPENEMKKLVDNEDIYKKFGYDKYVVENAGLIYAHILTEYFKYDKIPATCIFYNRDENGHHFKWLTWSTQVERHEDILKLCIADALKIDRKYQTSYFTDDEE